MRVSASTVRRLFPRELGDGAATRWCVCALAAAIVLFAAGLSLNWLVDPYHAFRQQDLYIIGTGSQRAMYAGLIRSRPDTEAVVIGSSLGANFDPDLVKRTFGYETQILSLWGGAPREIYELVQYSLRHQRKLQAMFIEFFPPAACNFAWSPAARFPVEMYDDRPIARLAHLASATTLQASAVTVLHRWLGWYPREFGHAYSDVYRTYEEMKGRYGNVAVLRQLADDMADPAVETSEATIEAAGKRDAACFRSHYQSIVEQHPSVQFFFFTDPTFQWGLAKLDLRASSSMYESLAQSIGRRPNVQFHDFIPAADIATDCARWVDLWHFDQEASDRIIEKMKSGAYRRTAASNARLDAETRRLMRSPADCRH